MKRVIKNPHVRQLNMRILLDSYIEMKEARNLSKDTIRNIKLSVNKWLNYLEASEYDLDPSKLDSKYIYSFSKHYLGEELRPTSLNHYLRDIRTFVYWMADEGYCQRFKIDLVKEQEAIVDTYTDEEMELLLAKPHLNATYGEWRTWAVINWMYATGNRASTVCNIKLEDLNFTKQEIRITKTKTNKAYIIPMSTALRNVIQEFVEQWRAEVFTSPNSYLFANIGDEKLTTNALHLAVVRYNQSRGVEKTSVHAFRHTFAKAWVRNNGDVFRLQKMLGHTTLDMTKRYVNMFSEDLKEGFNNFNPLDRMKKGTSRTKKIQKN